MRRPTRAVFVAATAIVAALLVAPDSDARDEDIDVRMPVRVGWGYAAAYPAPALTFAVDSELIARVSERVGVFFTGGFEGVTVYDPRSPDRPRGFFGIGIGGGVFLRSPEVGPAISVAVPLSLDFRNDEVAGVGVGIRAMLFPYYHSITEAIACARGPFGSYIASSFFMWTGVRFDLTDESKGAIVSFGAGVDVARALLLPFMGWIFREGCSKNRAGERLVD